MNWKIVFFLNVSISHSEIIDDRCQIVVYRSVKIDLVVVTKKFILVSINVLEILLKNS